MKIIAVILLACGLSSFAVAPTDSSLSDDVLVRIRFEQRPGTQLSPALVFRDETGRSVRLGDYFGTKPIVLIPGYYGCPMLCSLVLNGATESFRGLKGNVGEQFEVVFVSIDPSETPALAAAKKETYLRSYGRGRPDGWHFLTGDTNAIRALTAEIGFHFAYDPVARQFAHPSGFVVLTPDGKVSRYFTGITFAAKDVDFALRAARAGRAAPAASTWDLLCFHYAPLTGKYGNLVMTIVRAAGITTVLALGVMVFSSHRRRPLR